MAPVVNPYTLRFDPPSPYDPAFPNPLDIYTRLLIFGFRPLFTLNSLGLSRSHP